VLAHEPEDDVDSGSGSECGCLLELMERRPFLLPYGASFSFPDIAIASH
jgi:hypothetical protein